MSINTIAFEAPFKNFQKNDLLNSKEKRKVREISETYLCIQVSSKKQKTSLVSKENYLNLTFGSDFETKIAEKFGSDLSTVKEVFLKIALLIEKKSANDALILKSAALEILFSEFSFASKKTELAFLVYFIDQNFPVLDAKVEIDKKWHFFEDYVIQRFENRIRSFRVHNDFAKISSYNFLDFCSQFVFLKDGTCYFPGFEALFRILDRTQAIGDDHKFNFKLILNTLLASSEFLNFFHSEINIHPQLNGILNCTLQQEPNHINRSFDAKRALFFALFWNVRQSDDMGNCYAVSTFNFLLFTNPCKIINFLIEILNFNHIKIEGNLISASELWAKKESRHSLFEGRICPDNFIRHPFVWPILKANKIALTALYSDKECSINDFFKLIILNEKLSETFVPIFQSYYEAFVYNPLQTLLIEIFELISANRHQEIDISKRFFFNGRTKYDFFAFFQKELEHALIVQEIFSDATYYLINQWSYFFRKYFILEPVHSFNSENKFLELSIPNNEVINRNTRKLLTKYFRFLFIKDGKHIVITNFEIFFEKLIEIFEDLIQEISSQSLIEKFSQFVKSADFQILVFKSFEFINEKFSVKIGWKDQVYINKPYIHSTGGFFVHILKHLNLSYDTYSLVGKDCKDFLFNFLNYTKSNNICSSLVSSSRHTFILPQRFIKIFQKKFINLHEGINKWVIDPSNALLNTSVNEEIIKGLNAIITDEQHVKFEELGYFKNSISLRTFRNRITQFLTSHQKIQFRNYFNDFLIKIDIKKFLNEYLILSLKDIGYELHVNSLLDDEEIRTFIEIRYEACSYRVEELAIILQNALQALYHLYLEVEVIESILYKNLKIPYFFRIADLNYQTLDFFKEREAHSYLCVKYDLFLEEFVFTNNFEDTDIPLEDPQQKSYCTFLIIRNL